MGQCANIFILVLKQCILILCLYNISSFMPDKLTINTNDIYKWYNKPIKLICPTNITFLSIPIWQLKLAGMHMP